MSDCQAMILGEKENFLIRVLMNKLKGADIDSIFVKWSVNAINASWDESELIILFMDEGAVPPDDTIHFLTDKMVEENKQMVVIGEKSDVDMIVDNVPSDMILKTFSRPIDNEEFVETVRIRFNDVMAGKYKKSILIVDDDPNYMSLVREWLKGTYKVSMANSGMQALKWLGRNKADLILLDHEMPVTSGPQVLEMLRSEEETKDIPVFFLTAKNDRASVMAVVALKPEGYFLKTIQRNELLKELGEYFLLHR